MRAKVFWRQLRLPLAMLVLVCILVLVWKLLDLPSDEEVIALINRYFGTYGYWVIFASAVVEGFLLLGFYFPGSTVIFLGVVLAGDDLVKIASVVAVTTAGLLLTHTLNYFLGKYGWYRVLARLGLHGAIEKAKSRLTQYGPKAILLSNWHPNMGALTSTAAGILGFPFKRFFFYTFVSVTAWDIFWGTCAYVLGTTVYNFLGPVFAFIVVGVWIIISIVKAVRTKPDLNPADPRRDF